MYLSKLLLLVSPIFPFDDTCIANLNTTDVVACNNEHDAGFVETEEAFGRNIQSCQSDFCAFLDYAASEGPMGMCSCGIVFCSNAAYRAPTMCDEGNEYLLSLAHLIKCTLDAAQEAFRQRKEIISAKNDSQVKEDGDASQSCQDLVSCEESVLKSATKAWATRYCSRYIDLMLSPEISPNGEYAWIEECGIDHPTVAPLTALCMDVFSSNVIDEGAGIITYLDSGVPVGTIEANAAPSSATTYVFTGVAGLFLSSVAMLYI